MEGGYVLAKVASIANERCGDGVLLRYGGHAMGESLCHRVWSGGGVFHIDTERTGYFDNTIFRVAQAHKLSIEQFRKDWLAQSKTDVATIVWFDYKQTRVGVYSNGDGAFRHSVSLSIIDVQRRLIVAQKTFTGPEPPETIRIGRPDRVDRLPSRDEIAQWLAGLRWKREFP
jgi:hypothetical protein